MISRILKHLLSAGFIVFIVSILPGCDGEGIEWEEDRGIPFSSDDRAIAYRHRGAVYVARTQGDKHHRIFKADSDAVLSTPHWAPGQKALVFAILRDRQEPSGNLHTYELWLWPAPEDIWTSAATNARQDTVALPTRWKPAEPRKLTSARCLALMQVKADALFKWHPDGGRIFFQDADESGRQSVISLDLDTGERTIASPVTARSLAFSISPRGNYLAVAAQDPDPAALWYGPVGGEITSWQQVDGMPGPRLVPKLVTEGDNNDKGGVILYDLRPRLGAWSPDSQWFAHVQIPAEEKSEGAQERLEEGARLIISSVQGDMPQWIIPVPGGRVENMHWTPDGNNLGFLGDKKVLLVDSGNGIVSELSGFMGVEQFIGWSAPGRHMAYLIRAEEFERTSMVLPTGHRLEWAPARRHNLVLAMADGKEPRSGFSLMNISSAQWGNQTEKLSFWATHLPTVSHLPPGDPAAVLDVEHDAIRWYPTDVAEYAQVGHYYFLNGQFGEAAKHYSDAINKLPEPEESRVLEARIRLWRGLSRIAAQDKHGVLEDLNFFREHIVPPRDPDAGISENREEPLWDETTFRDLTADRILLSTLLSMRQIKLAVAQAKEIIGQTNDVRRIQALCFLALIDRGTAQHELFTTDVVTDLIPAVIQSQQMREDLAEELVKELLNAVANPNNLRQLSDRSKQRFAGQLAELAAITHDADIKISSELARHAAIFYREAGETQRELQLLRAADLSLL